jgi:hypothetical protein
VLQYKEHIIERIPWANQFDWPKGLAAPTFCDKRGCDCTSVTTAACSLHRKYPAMFMFGESRVGGLQTRCRYCREARASAAKWRYKDGAEERAKKKQRVRARRAVARQLE